MKISVALCTYMGERFLNEQLTSLSEQIRQPDELVVFDDGSTDGTLAILEAFQKQVSFPVRVTRNKKQLGYILNFEQAILACSGDIIAPCDQDDVWYPEKLERFEEVFAGDEGIDIVFCDADVVREDLTLTKHSTWERRHIDPAYQRLIGTDRAFDLLLERNSISGNTMAFRARCRELATPFHERWEHDYWVAILAAAAAKGRIQPLPQRLVAYRQHRDNVHGVVQGGLVTTSRQLKHAVRGSRREFHKMAEKYGFLRDRLSRLDDASRRAKLIAFVDGKIAHLETRAGMSAHRLQRIPVIAAEILRGNYFRYARKGLITALRDVLW